MKTRKTTVFVQVEQQLIIRTTASPIEGWCDRCGSQSGPALKDEAESLQRGDHQNAKEENSNGT